MKFSSAGAVWRMTWKTMWREARGSQGYTLKDEWRQSKGFKRVWFPGVMVLVYIIGAVLALTLVPILLRENYNRNRDYLGREYSKPMIRARRRKLFRKAWQLVDEDREHGTRPMIKVDCFAPMSGDSYIEWVSVAWPLEIKQLLDLANRTTAGPRRREPGHGSYAQCVRPGDPPHGNHPLPNPPKVRLRLHGKLVECAGPVPSFQLAEHIAYGSIREGAAVVHTPDGRVREASVMQRQDVMHYYNGTPEGTTDSEEGMHFALMFNELVKDLTEAILNQPQ